MRPQMISHTNICEFHIEDDARAIEINILPQFNFNDSITKYIIIERRKSFVGRG
jgi:hypothetical protein